MLGTRRSGSAPGRGNQQATLRGKFPSTQGVLRDYEQRGCDAEDIVQPLQECGIGC